MSRKLLAFLSSELKTVRLICPRDVCGAVTEVGIDRMSSVGHKGACPVCGHDLYPGGFDGDQNPLFRLAAAIEATQRAQAKSGAIQVEFVLPDTSAD